MELRAQIRTYLKEGLDQLNLSVSPLSVEKLIDYFEILLRANESLNLISAKQDLKTRVAVHLLDSLSPLLWSDWPPFLSVMDIGSGGGFPAIPLALAFPEWKITLAESTGKKAIFLSAVKDQLKLDNVSISNKYMEPDKNPDRQQFDLITARGVSDLKKLIAIAGPRLKTDGWLLAFKGPNIYSELNEATSIMSKWKIMIDDQINFILPLVEAHRTLLRLVKTEAKNR